VTSAVLTDSAQETGQTIAVAGTAEVRSEVLDALCQLGFEVSLADGLEDLAEICWERTPAAIVLVGAGPIAAGGSTLASVREHARDARVVLVCDSVEGWEVRAALAAGAAGIVSAAEVPTALGPCVRAVQAGQICVPRRNRGQIERPVLSAREKQILGLVVMGYMNGQIAERLFLAESTVKSHLSSAFGKLEVHSRHEAVDLILDPERGLALGILALGGEPLAGCEPVLGEVPVAGGGTAAGGGPVADRGPAAGGGRSGRGRGARS
jgi:DNA-binding NarL/FixJ family response regulator